MTKKGQYQIPFDTKGNQLSYVDTYWGRDAIMKDNYEFEDTLVYSGYGRGRSSVTMDFKSKTDEKNYSMFISDFDSVVSEMVNGEVKGKFTFVKKGKTTD